MKKRGLTLLTLFEILMTVLVFSFMIYRAIGIGSGEVFYKNHVAKDIALTADAVQASPGNVRVLYGVDVSDYDVNFKDGKVEVYPPIEGPAEYVEHYKASYGFVGGIETTLHNPKSIVFENTKDKLVVTENEVAKEQEG